MIIESVPKGMGLSYQIYVIGNNGPDMPTPDPSDWGTAGTDGRDANCNWASQCDISCLNGGEGGTGVVGKNGSPQSGESPINGKDAQPANITISDLIGSDLYLFSAGGNGGTAGGGGQGGTGGTGGRGGNGTGCPSGTHSCSGCEGGKGGTGGAGGNGGISGNGGNGTTVTVKYGSKEGRNVYYTNPQSAGGKLPLKGGGGVGGKGGSPGGNSGNSGGNGSDGSPGNSGNPSTVNVIHA